MWCKRERIGRSPTSERSTGSFCIKNTLTNREKVRSNRERVTCNRVCLSEVQPVHIPTRKDHSTIWSQAPTSNLQEICVSSSVQFAKDATPPTKVQSGCHIQTRFADVHSRLSFKGLPRQPRRGRQRVSSVCIGGWNLKPLGLTGTLGGLLMHEGGSSRCSTVTASMFFCLITTASMFFFAWLRLSLDSKSRLPGTSAGSCHRDTL